MYLLDAPWQGTSNEYGKSPKIPFTKVFDKMAYANSVDQEQTAPEGAVWSGSTLFVIPLSISRSNCIKSKILAQIVWNKAFELFKDIFLAYKIYLEK